MDQKTSLKHAYNFKDKASAFNYLMANAPVGSLEKVLLHFSNLYKFKEEASKTIEGILNYHLNHFSIIPHKENFVLLTSANWLLNKQIKLLPMNIFSKELNLDKPNYANIFNPLHDRLPVSRSSTRYTSGESNQASTRRPTSKSISTPCSWIRLSGAKWRWSRWT